jgi:fructose-1,6-bisphosphatase-3
MDVYGNDPCKYFMPKIDEDDDTHSEKSKQMLAQMHKAISIIQFKIEGALIEKYPDWDMKDRNLLHRIDFEKGTITLPMGEYKLRDTNFPTVDPKDPYKLTVEEAELIGKLKHSFIISDKLRKHMYTLLSHGAIYGIFNGNLLYHAAMPLNEDGTLKDVTIDGEQYRGRALLDQVNKMVRSAFDDDAEPSDRKFAIDYFWYLWCGPNSPLFDKSAMTTFERYFIEDKTTHHEEKGNYYKLRDNEEVCEMILDEFKVNGAHRHIINGHVPVKTTKGEKPIKANGKLMVIDGGFAKAYHDTTGIAGYTLVFHSRGFDLVQHEPFTSARNAILHGTDIVSTNQIVELSAHRMRVRDTDKGLVLQSQIDELMELLYAYRHGLIPERASR